MVGTCRLKGSIQLQSLAVRNTLVAGGMPDGDGLWACSEGCNQYSMLAGMVCCACNLIIGCQVSGMLFLFLFFLSAPHAVTRNMML